jgi:SsrA-binding protein
MSIVDNKKAFHDYFVEEKYEAGLVLEGWEVKAIRAGRAQIKEGYVVLKSASTHVYTDPTRSRKLLLNAAEIAKLIGKVERSGYTLVPIDLHFNGGRIKLTAGLAKGKKQHDKRNTEKDRDANREIARAMRSKRAVG